MTDRSATSTGSVAPLPDSKRPSTFTARTILIVDDHSVGRRLLTTMLRDSGHRLLQAADGVQGLAAARAEHPDLVITDLLMPVMDGYEFVRQLRLDPATHAVPVVFYTAHYGEREARDMARSLGVSAVLTKPARSADVLRAVASALAGEPVADAPSRVTAPSTFDREHLRLMSDKVSEKSEDLRTTNARLRALLNIGLELASERNVDQLLHRVCAEAHDLFSATYVTLGIIDLADRTVQRVVTCGTEATDWIKTGDPVSGVLGAVVAERRTVRADNRGADPAGLQFPPRHPEVQAFLAAPIASPVQVYGWFCLVGNEGRAFTEDDQDLVTALSGQVGRIYESSHFHAEALQRTGELEQEIVERHQAEAALRLERDRSQRYLDTAAVIMLALDRDGRITLVNRHACAVLGWTADELLGRDWIETCLPLRIRNRDLLVRLFDGAIPVAENFVLTRSGEERLIDWRNTVQRDGEGRVVGSLSSGTDITDRNRAEAAQTTAEERTRFALEAAGVGIWDMDYTTGALQWSNILESQYGLPPGTFGGTFEAFLDGVHPLDRDAVHATMAQATRSGADFTLQHRTLRPDGTTRWLSGAGRIHLGEHGEPVRGVGISLDVTEHHTLEEQHRHAQRMDAIGRLAGGVAHDFNNLLTSILVNCELLLEGLGPDDPNRAGLAEIQKAGESGAGLTRQLLAFSRKQIIEPALLDLNVVVTDMRALLGRLIGDDVSIVLSLRTGLGFVKTDRSQVEQVLMNLAVNARDAMPKGGTVTIETANLDLGADDVTSHPSVKPGSYVALTVSDTGTGMTAAVQAHLFEPFFTTKDVGKGTGLGLATVHGIVSRSGGCIDVTSEVGRGSSFKAYFPRAEAAGAVVAAPAPVITLPPGAHTVLVVDDAAELRLLAGRLLRRLGYTVMVAATADEAIRLIEENAAIDVLLTDVVMPGASGPELTSRLVGLRPSLKVIYMSGYSEEAIVQQGNLKPGIAFLEKPFTSDTLGRKLDEVLHR